MQKPTRTGVILPVSIVLDADGKLRDRFKGAAVTVGTTHCQIMSRKRLVEGQRYDN